MVVAIGNRCGPNIVSVIEFYLRRDACRGATWLRKFFRFHFPRIFLHQLTDRIRLFLACFVLVLGAHRHELILHVVTLALLEEADDADVDALVADGDDVRLGALGLFIVTPGGALLSAKQRMRRTGGSFFLERLVAKLRTIECFLFRALVEHDAELDAERGHRRHRRLDRAGRYCRT